MQPNQFRIQWIPRNPSSGCQMAAA